MISPLPTGAANCSASPDDPAAVTGVVRQILRVEGVAGLVICVAFYAVTGFGWGYFALLFLVPDFSLLFYLLGPRAGAVAYNVAHSTIGPITLGIAGFLLGIAVIPSLALIWTAHILFDRLLGMGLKYPAGFRYTHLGWPHLGRPRVADRQKRASS